ncbi:MAG: hypothetical protein ABR499_00900 [Gemmatimonadaceae bacterium]
MSEMTDDVQRDIAQTRARMSATIAELDARISGRVAVVKEKLDLMQLVEDHPWAALSVALGLGVLLAGTGADAKAARATARAAKAAPGATADLARRGWDAAASKVRRDGDGEHEAPVEPAEPGFADRIRATITRATGVDELIGQMRGAAEELSRPASYVGQNVPRNTGQQM